MTEEHTTGVVQRYLDALAGDSPAEPIIRALLDRPSAACNSCAPTCSIEAIRG